MKVRQGQDPGVFFVESTSKLETKEHSCDLFEMVCTCTDYTARCAPRRRANPDAPTVFHPSPDRSACKHLGAAIFFLGRLTARRWKEEHNKQQKQ